MLVALPRGFPETDLRGLRHLWALASTAYRDSRASYVSGLVFHRTLDGVNPLNLYNQTLLVRSGRIDLVTVWKMVFCGKPSGGCYSCRSKKSRVRQTRFRAPTSLFSYDLRDAVINKPQCDQRPEGCGQCKRTKRKCPGYRVLADVIFRNESDNVIQKFKAKEAKKMAAMSLASVPSPSSQGSDCGSLESLELVMQMPAPMVSYGVAQPLEDQALLFFVANYVISCRGPVRGHLDYVADLYQTDYLPEALMSSMRAVGLAGYSHAVHAPSLMNQARHQYLRAIQLTNAALNSPTDVRKDATLMAIMILGIFETVTGCNQRSLTAWAEHIAGAAALLKLRGLDQLSTGAGRRLFIQVSSNLMISCIQRGIYLPDYIIKWTAEARKFLPALDPAWDVQELMMEFTQLYASKPSPHLLSPSSGNYIARIGFWVECRKHTLTPGDCRHC